MTGDDARKSGERGVQSEKLADKLQQSNSHVREARAFLDDFESEDLEVRHGQLEHAINSLRNAKRCLPDDF